jgi:hypothetical protein
LVGFFHAVVGPFAHGAGRFYLTMRLRQEKRRFYHACDSAGLKANRAGHFTHTDGATISRTRRRGVQVRLVGLNAASASIMKKLAVHDQPEALERAPGH